MESEHREKVKSVTSLDEILLVGKGARAKLESRNEDKGKQSMKETE